jgi:hypothetical protein
MTLETNRPWETHGQNKLKRETILSRLNGVSWELENWKFMSYCDVFAMVVTEKLRGKKKNIFLNYKIDMRKKRKRKKSLIQKTL